MFISIGLSRDIAQLVERYFWEVGVGGSNPSVPIKRGSETVSHESHKLVIAGSTPVPATKLSWPIGEAANS